MSSTSREPPSTHPPSGRATPLTRGVALVHGGQRPISLEYQINRLPPIISDTLVTGMVQSSTSSVPVPVGGAVMAQFSNELSLW